MSITPIQATPARQYKGMRYVPIFDGDWDNTKDYNPLVIVSYQGNSYTSRTFVPAGTDITNKTYWALTGNYNAQVEAYRQEVAELSEDVDNLTKLNDIFFSGDYNITRMDNTAGSNTLIYWRFIPKNYKPKLAYIEDNNVDYAVKMACENGATCAINASRFNMEDNTFFGYFRDNHHTLHGNDAGGSTTTTILYFKNDKLGSIDATLSTSELNENDYEWALCGFDTIIEGGEILPDPDDSYHPRSFIAQTINGDYIIGCCDGRSGRSAGLTLNDVATFLTSLGHSIDFAYSLDGGGSVTLVEKGDRVNSYINDENRKVKSIIYFKKDGAQYNDLLKNCVTNIDNAYRAHLKRMLYQEGDFHTYANLVEDDVTGTTDISFYDLEKHVRESSYRTQKDRFFVVVQNDFSSADGEAYNILDIYNRPTFKKFIVGNVAKALFNETYNDDYVEDTFDTIPNITGIYRVRITDPDVAVSLGLTSDDIGRIALFRIRLNENHDILMTHTHVYYRWAGGVWKQLDNAT